MDARITFSGFYESKWSNGLDIEEEQWAEHLAEKHGVLASDICDLWRRHAEYSEGREHVAEKYVDSFENILNESLGLSISLTFQRITSPRYYNFETDHIHVDISYRDALILARRVGRNRLRKAAKELFTSRSGFISYYHNDPAEWGRLRGWDACQMLALFTAAEYLIEETYEDYQWSIYEALSCNGVFHEAVSKSVYYDEFEIDLGKLIGRKELLEEQAEEAADEDRNFPDKWRNTQDYVAQYHAMNKSVFHYPEI